MALVPFKDFREISFYFFHLNYNQKIIIQIVAVELEIWTAPTGTILIYSTTFLMCTFNAYL